MIFRQFIIISTLLATIAILQKTQAIDEIKIGILIRHRGLEVPLNRTLDNLNADTTVLSSTKLIAIVELIESENSYEISAAVCKLMSQNVWAIIGPQSIQMTPIIQSITAHYHIPLILINWQPNSYYPETITRSLNKRQARNDQDHSVPQLLNYTLNLYPQADQLSKAYLDMIKYKQWKTFSLIYDSPEDFALVKDVFELTSTETNINIEKINLPQEFPEVMTNDNDPDMNSYQSQEGGDKITQVQYCTFDGNNINLAYQKVMKSLRKKGVENFLLSMSLDKACKVLKEASNVDLLTIYNDYIIANLDSHLLNLTQLQPLMTNISGYSILDPEGQQIDFAPSKRWLGKRPFKTPKERLSTEYSMLSDAMSLIAYALDDFINETGGQITIPNCDCDSNQIWPYGGQLMDIFKGTIRHGAYTGDLRFDKFGQRVDFNLEYIAHKNNTFKKLGTWNIADRLNKTKQSDSFGFGAIENMTLIVTVALTTPYVILKPNSSELVGNDKYEGYCIDLMSKLARELKFNFVIKEVSDGKYGNPTNGSWNGMIRELLDWKADLAIVDLTITKERQSAVDFTHPFMTLGIAIMYKRPKLEEVEMYSFLMPFSQDVWLSMGSAYLCIGLTSWGLSRLSPVEWKNAHPCVDVQSEADLENEIHSIGASLWFNIGSLMQQGSDLAPKSLSVRSLSSYWYFFTLILISSYTANFAAFLTASRMQSPIENAEDLSKQTKIDYGCKDTGSTQTFFSSSNHSTYRRMWNFMDSRRHQGVFPKDNDKGVKMVKRGNFAFLMESTSIEYIAQRDCELTQIGGLLDHKGYGIALRKRSPYRAALSRAIVDLTERGELQDLKSRWWNSDTRCPEEKDSALATSELGIDKLGGVFLLLAYGIAIACVAAILEFFWKSFKRPYDETTSVGRMLYEEILRILTCGPSKRPAPESSYNKSTSQASVANLDASATSLNKSNYVTAPIRKASNDFVENYL